MNKTRAKALKKIFDKLDDLRVAVEYLKEEETEAYDNLPESLQYSERGEVMSECIDALESFDSSMEEAMASLSEIIDNYNL